MSSSSIFISQFIFLCFFFVDVFFFRCFRWRQLDPLRNALPRWSCDCSLLLVLANWSQNNTWASRVIDFLASTRLGSREMSCSLMPVFTCNRKDIQGISFYFALLKTFFFVLGTRENYFNWTSQDTFLHLCGICKLVLMEINMKLF